MKGLECKLNEHVSVKQIHDA